MWREGGVLLIRLCDPLTLTIEKLLGITSKSPNAVGFYLHSRLPGYEDTATFLFSTISDTILGWPRLGYSLASLLSSGCIEYGFAHPISEPYLERLSAALAPLILGALMNQTKRGNKSEIIRSRVEDRQRAILLHMLASSTEEKMSTGFTVINQINARLSCSEREEEVSNHELMLFNIFEPMIKLDVTSTVIPTEIQEELIELASVTMRIVLVDRLCIGNGSPPMVSSLLEREYDFFVRLGSLLLTLDIPRDKIIPLIDSYNSLNRSRTIIGGTPLPSIFSRNESWNTYSTSISVHEGALKSIGQELRRITEDPSHVNMGLLIGAYNEFCECIDERKIEPPSRGSYQSILVVGDQERYVTTNDNRVILSMYGAKLNILTIAELNDLLLYLDALEDRRFDNLQNEVTRELARR